MAHAGREAAGVVCTQTRCNRPSGNTSAGVARLRVGNARSVPPGQNAGRPAGRRAGRPARPRSCAPPPGRRRRWPGRTSGSWRAAASGPARRTPPAAARRRWRRRPARAGRSRPRRRRRAAARPRRRRPWAARPSPDRSAASSRSSASSCAPARIRSISCRSGPPRPVARSTLSTASSAERALSRSRRSLNWVCSTRCSSPRPLRATSSVASAAGLRRALPDQAGGQPDAEDAEALQQLSPAGRIRGRAANRSTERSCGVQRPPWARPASSASAANSVWRSVRPVSAISPATATTFWHSPRIVGSAR